MTEALSVPRSERKVPIRNLWWLMLYASDLFTTLGHSKQSLDEDPDEIPDLVAELLVRIVEARIHRGLARGYRHEAKVLSRVRGRIDVLPTESRQLLLKGQVHCTYEMIDVDTVPNRLARGALDKLSWLVSDRELGRRCHNLARSLVQKGVTGDTPSRFVAGQFRAPPFDRDLKKMVEVARLAFDLALPNEMSGEFWLDTPQEGLLWKLYERAVYGFYSVVLPPEWYVRKQVKFSWPVIGCSEGACSILPGMSADLVLDHGGRRLVIDTKCMQILNLGQWGSRTLSTSHLYQIYAYLQTQAAEHPTAEGLLLYPEIGNFVDAWYDVQGHRIRAATVDLMAEPKAIRARLIELVDEG